MRALITTPIKDKSDFWVLGNDDLIYHIKEGTGDNLLQEDIDAGYVDYIYIDIFKNNLTDIEDGNIHDGGQILLKEYYKDLTVVDILGIVEEFFGVRFFSMKSEDWEIMLKEVAEDVENEHKDTSC